MARVLTVRCPDCGSSMQVDAETGMVVDHRTGQRPSRVDLDRAQEQLRREQEQRDDLFRQSVQAEKNRDELLARKFDQSLKRVKEHPETPRPMRDVDLD